MQARAKLAGFAIPVACQTVGAQPASGYWAAFKDVGALGRDFGPATIVAVVQVAGSLIRPPVSTAVSASTVPAAIVLSIGGE